MINSTQICAVAWFLMIEPVQAALNYYCAVRSQELSFAELFEDIMSRWVDTVDSAWRLCVRFKRGLQDTGKHGGYCRDTIYMPYLYPVDTFCTVWNPNYWVLTERSCCRDQCYFIGAIKLLKRRSTLDFRLFHAGAFTYCFINCCF